MRLDDFLVLGRTVPEDSRHYGVRICMVGYSPELRQLMRVYPLTIDNPLRVRHEATLDVQRNPLDNRSESFKLNDAVNGIYRVSEKPICTIQDTGILAEKLAFRSIAAMNELRVSVGFVAIHGTPTLLIKTHEDHPNGPQQELFDEFVHDLRVNKFLVPGDYPQIPYLRFRDDGGWHDLQLREWGSYEYLRKHEFKPDGLAAALRLNTDTNQSWFALVGNMSHRRTVWLVINLFRMSKVGELTLFEREI